MNATEYNTTGSYVAISGLVVSALGHFGILASASEIGIIIGGIVALVGIVKQIIAHKALNTQAVKAGAITK